MSDPIFIPLIFPTPEFINLSYSPKNIPTLKGKGIFDNGATNNEIPEATVDEKGIRLEFAQFGHFDSFDIIRSMTSMVGVADADLPTPIATGLKSMYYVDTSIVSGPHHYFYKVRVWRGEQSFVSDEISVYAMLQRNYVDLSVEDGVLINKGDTSWENFRGVQFIEDYMLFNAATSSDNTSYLQSSDTFNWSGDWEFEAEIMRVTTTSATGTIFSNNNTTGSAQTGSCWIYVGPTSGSTATVRNRFHIGGAISDFGTVDVPVSSYQKVKMRKQGLVVSSFINDVLTNSFNITAAQQAALNIDRGPMNIGNNIINQESGQFVGRIKWLTIKNLIL